MPMQHFFSITITIHVATIGSVDSHLLPNSALSVRLTRDSGCTVDGNAGALEEARSPNNTILHSALKGPFLSPFITPHAIPCTPGSR